MTKAHKKAVKAYKQGIYNLNMNRLDIPFEVRSKKIMFLYRMIRNIERK